MTSVVPTAPRPAGVQKGDMPEKEFKANNYATRKTIAQGLLDMALLTANVNQLKQCLDSEMNNYFYINLSLIISSIILQVVVGGLCLYIGSISIDKEAQRDRLTWMNSLVTYLTFIITVINIVISGLGLGNANKPDIDNKRHAQ